MLPSMESHLDSTISKCTWQPEEDESLKQLVKMHGDNNWKMISNDLGNRSDVQCRYRYHQIISQLEIPDTHHHQRREVLQLQEIQSPSPIQSTQMQSMPQYMVTALQNILVQIAKGERDQEISQFTGHGRNLIREVRKAFNTDSPIFGLSPKQWRPTKRSLEMIQRVEQITVQNRRMSCSLVSRLISEDSEHGTISPTTIWRIRGKSGVNYLPPISALPLSVGKRQVRQAFAQHHLHVNTNWDSTLFTDESYIYLDNNHRWLWRRRGEIDPAVFHQRSRFPAKLLIFGGISKHWVTPVVFVEGIVDTISYMDDCIDETGLIPEMNRVYGNRAWTLMQDGASAHRSKATLEYLNLYCKLLDNWPPDSPDLNPIENLWAIIKKRIEDMNPQIIQELKELIITVWDSIEIELIHNLIDSMPNRLQAVVTNHGGRTGY